MRRNSIEAILHRLNIRKAMKIKPEPPTKYCSWCEEIMPTWKKVYCSNKCTRQAHNRID